LEDSNVRTAVEDRVVLVTGAGGSIGSALAGRLELFQPRHLILLDHSERNLNEIRSKITNNNSRTSFVLGSVSDLDLLAEIFGTYRPQIVFHAAAFKHVPLMELNPIAAVQNNAIATYELAKLCRDNSVSNLVLLSTDKAVNPISIMGASKRVAELALNHTRTTTAHMTAVRLGNVLSTEGSVVPLFLSQIRNGGPVTVTDPRATRYFFTLDEAIDLVLSVAAQDASEIFIPTVNAPINIHAMALELIRESKSENHNDIEVSFTGLRPGDKLTEEFLYADEAAHSTIDPRLFRVVSDIAPLDSFDAEINSLSRAAEARNVPATIELIRRLVPQYQPSETLMRPIRELGA
jgi:FlaA1/EpsC-like NDP-sugar epimerase